MLKAYIKYRRKRLNAHGLHSPFVYHFYTTVIKAAKRRNTINVERIRKDYSKDNSQIEILDYGAGSRKNKGNVRRVSDLAKISGIRKKYGRLLAEIVDHYKIETALELGTSLGIGTAYLLNGNENLKLFTVEGCDEIADKAQTNLSRMNPANLTICKGEFSEILKQDVLADKVYDLIYIDGNHLCQPTLDYFEFALNHTHDEAFIIFDDIHWSSEMENAWQQIKADERIHVTMDLFQLGIVCKRHGQRKQDFILKY